MWKDRGKRMAEQQKENRSEVIAGRNPVSEALRGSRPIDKIMVARGEKSGAVVGILAKAREKKIPVKEVDRQKLDYISGGAVHQGIIAFAAVKEYCSVEDIFACAAVIVPKRRSAGLSYTVGKASAGAIEYMNVARVTNIAATVDDLKARGVWVYGADMNGTDYERCDFAGPCAIVIGNEGKGISRLVREKCDVIVSLPMKGRINSLNASVAAGILMYQAMKKR